MNNTNSIQNQHKNYELKQRERLTTDKTKIFIRENITLMSVTKDELRRHYNEIFDRLQEYEVAEETGQIIVLPHALGSKVYCLGQPCGGCECYNEPMKEEFIERCRKCDNWEIGECEFDYELIPEWGKLVFPTREQAEEALKKS